MTYSFTITNVKSSIKLRPPVEFDFVTHRCRESNAYCKRYGNLLSIKHKKKSFVLFKSCDFSPNSGQHLNITSCRNTDETLQAIEDFYHLIGRPSIFTNYRVDNYSCTSEIGHRIDLESFYLSNSNHRVVYNPESFPGLFLWSPKKSSLCAVIYHTEKVNIVGSNNIEEIEEFLKWVKQVTVISSSERNATKRRLELANENHLKKKCAKVKLCLD